MARLLTLIPKDAVTFPGFRPGQMSTLHVGKDGKYKDWIVHVRGPQLFIQGPPGWRPGGTTTDHTRYVCELPRSLVYLAWELAPGEDLRDLVNWSPEDVEDAPPLAEVEEQQPVSPGITLVAVEPGSALEPVGEADVPPLAPEVEELDPDDDDDLPRQAPAKKGNRR